MLLVHLLQIKTEIRPYYLRPQAGIMLSLSSSVRKWARTESTILFFCQLEAKAWLFSVLNFDQCLNF